MITLLDRLHAINPDPDFIASGLINPFRVPRNMSTITHDEYLRYRDEKIRLFEADSRVWYNQSYCLHYWGYDYAVRLGNYAPNIRYWFIGVDFAKEEFQDDQVPVGYVPYPW